MSYTREQIILEEQKFLFERFNSEDAWSIGEWLANKAKEKQLSIAIYIERCGHTLFQFANEGTTVNNDNWLKAKSRTVHYFECSSLATGIRLKEEGITIEEDSKISSTKYFPVGGAFPIRIRNTGVIGTIVVSGLEPEEDHKLIIECLKAIMSY